MNLLRKTKLDRFMLILSAAAIGFAIFSYYLLMPHAAGFFQESNPERKSRMLLKLMLDVRFIIPIVVGGLSALILPVYFCFKNVNSYGRKWVLVVITSVVWIFSLSSWLALFCLACYAVNFLDEFQKSRSKK